MRRALAINCLALVCLLAGLAPTAGAAAGAPEIGKIQVAETPAGRPSLLVPVTYPIELAGRYVRFSVFLRDPQGGLVYGSSSSLIVHAGEARQPERRERFVFVHRVDLSVGAISALPPDDIVLVRARVRPDGPSKYPPGLSLAAVRTETKSLRKRGEATCSTPAKLRGRPGRVLGTALPICTQPIRWSIAEPPEAGSAKIRGNRLIYNPAPKFRGTVSVTLAGRRGGAAASVTPVDAVAPVQILVASPGSPVVRVLGDSVTAGFGYYEDGSPMSIARLFSCRPPVGKYDDACSSNSKVQRNTVKEVEYAADYGLSNNVSWAAQWANEHGVTDYKNFAISGSRPQDWFGEGQFAATTKELESEDPDYVLLTIGANPILTETLFGVDNMECAVWADIFGEYKSCIERAFDKVNLAANLRGLYSELVENTDAQIIAMQYHLSVPSSALAYTAVQIAEMADLMNEEIAAAAAAVSKSRIDVVAPPHFNVGISLAPVYPAKYKCKGLLFNSRVDGPSVQATPSQVFLRAAHPLEFCGGPVTGPPWVISGDTGIHPSAAGYAQMASQVPAPE
jgi:lysophospholipase L1-like esterase